MRGADAVKADVADEGGRAKAVIAVVLDLCATRRLKALQPVEQSLRQTWLQ
jgi:hypothetical protein